MKRSLPAKDPNGLSVDFEADKFPDRCPICRRGGEPTILSAEYFEPGHDHYDRERYFVLQAVFRCPLNHCRGLYIGRYRAAFVLRGEACAWLDATQPNIYIEPPREEDCVKAISPRFYKIYAEATQAEANGLSEAAGPAYRKALEILIKDYLVQHIYKNDAPKAAVIPEKFLGRCIKEDIKDPTLQAVAERCTWIGNDETHYFRVHTAEDLRTLTKLLELTLHHISKDLQAFELINKIQKK